MPIKFFTQYQSLKSIYSLVLFALSVVCISPVYSAVVTYNKDLSTHKDVERSTFYRVEVIQNGNAQETFVSMAKANDVIDLTIGREKALQDRTISWASFDFSGTVKVVVTVLNTNKVPLGNNAIRLLPSQSGVVAKKTSLNQVEFILSNPDQLSLEIGNNGYKNGLMIFANSLETDVLSPSASDVYVCNPCNGIPSVPAGKSKVFFTDRTHNLGEWYIPKHIKEVYLAGNASVMGKFNLQGMNGPIKIYGRGSLINDVDEYQRKEQGMIKTIGGTNNVTIKDIVLVRREKLFGISLHGSGNLISNVKMVGGFNLNNDGILVGKGNSLCENTFLMVNDDGIKTFTEDAIYKNTTMWVLKNGAAIQTGWSSKTANNVMVDGLYLIRAEWDENTRNGAILNSRLKNTINGNNNLQKDITIKNVYTEHSLSQFIRLDNDPGTTHKVDGLQFINWNVDFANGGQNLLQYSSGYIKNVKFQNFIVNGECLHSFVNAQSQYNFKINSNTTGLSFSCSTPPVVDPVEPENPKESVASISDLTVSAVQCNEVLLSWSDVNTEDAYRVRRRIPGGSYEILTDLAANAQSYVDTQVDPGVTYEYMVRPMQNGVAVAVSNVPSVSVPQCPVANEPEITNISTACEDGSGTITFTFVDNPGRTHIAFSIDAGNTFTSVPDQNGSYTFGGLANGVYDLWTQWGNGDSPTDLEDVELSCKTFVVEPEPIPVPESEVPEEPTEPEPPVVEEGPVQNLAVVPQMVKDYGELHFSVHDASLRLGVEIFNSQGSKVRDFSVQNLHVGNNQIWIKDSHQLHTGVYVVKVSVSGVVVATTTFSKGR